MDLKGRLGNIRLPTSKHLLPVFEAVVNSIHAIEDAKRKDGRIDITIDRNSQKLLKEGDKEIGPIPTPSNFHIEDNGIGFTDEHFASFKKADSTLKVAKGGKGVGRLLWLLAFRKADIDSIYEQGGKKWRRTFEFLLTDKGVENDKRVPADGADRKTKVSLIGYKEPFVEDCPKTAAAIARRIVEHCLEYFIQPDCPSIWLHDPSRGDSYDLNHLFKTEMHVDSAKVSFKIKTMPFQITHVMIASTQGAEHSLHFCAHKRSVKSENAAKVVPNLEGPLKDESGRQLIYSGYLSGKFLNDRVLSERTRFEISDEETPLQYTDDLTWPELMSAAAKKSRDYLGPYTANLGEAKRQRIKSYIETKAKKYRPILKHRYSEIDEIPAGITDEKLELELYKIAQKYDADLYARYQDLLAQSDKKTLTLENRKQAVRVFLEEWNEAGMSKLAEHVAYRKATLAFLTEQLRLQENDKYALESSIHDVIFPIKKTSEDVRPDDMNLWVIDERLAYHYYLASDKEFNQLTEVVEIDSDKRTDLLLFFDNRYAFVDSELEFSAVVIIEFKRPSRNDYDADENPIDQVYEYVELLKAGKAKDRRGGFIKVPKDMPCYAYIICDMTEKIQKQALRHHFTATPDDEGFFGFSPHHSLYTEVISFKKVLRDATNRNKILFDHLGIL